MNEHLEMRSILGLPCSYKGIDIHPIKMIDSEKFYEVAGCLLLEKNKEKDIALLKMPYLKYLLARSMNGEEYLIYMLQELLTMTLQREFAFDEDQRKNIVVVMDGKVITHTDFDEIKNIILQQNLIRTNDMILDPEFEQALREAEDYFEKRNGKPATMAEKIAIYHVLTKTPYSEIQNLTIYQFYKSLERMSMFIDYQLLKSAELSGMVTFKEEIPHYMSHVPEKDPLSSLTTSYGEFEKFAKDNGISNT